MVEETPAMQRKVERALIVEDNDALRAALTRALESYASDVRAASTVAEARAHLQEWQPALVILDVALPDGHAFDVLQLLAPMPAVVAISGAAGPDEAFVLAQRGVRAFVRKPMELDELHASIAKALAEPPDLAPHLRATVGHRSLKDVEDEVRQVMVDEAMERSDGSRRMTARVLKMSRQLLQYILRRR